MKVLRVAVEIRLLLMSPRHLLLPLASALLLLPCHAEEKDTDLEAMIGRLAETSEEGFGYSSLFAGSIFLPRKDSGEWGVGVLGGPPATPSEAMECIVRQGAAAVPALIKHMDDKRETKLKPVAGMMWTEWSDEYDYNRRTRGAAPKGVNRDDFGGDQKHPDNHKITVGDLCFVALGQIVNRGFNASRYQPSGGMVISSPTYSKALLDVVKQDYGTMDAERHKKQLLDDFTTPDHESRRNGAVVRLGFYYPQELDKVVVKQLQVAPYDGFATQKFVREVLYREKSVEKRKEKLEAFLTKHGASAKDGILLDLFDDLDNQIADEEGRLHPPMKKNEKYDARNCLVQLFDRDPKVTPADKPYVAAWSFSEQARFIESLGPESSPAVIAEVHRIFSKLSDDDYLALACMKILKGKGHDEELRAYCKRRAKLSEYEGKELKAMLKELGDK